MGRPVGRGDVAIRPGCSLTIQTSMKSLTSRETHTRTLDCPVFSQCLNPLFRTFLMMIFSSNRKQRKHASETDCLTERERKEKVL